MLFVPRVSGKSIPSKCPLPLCPEQKSSNGYIYILFSHQLLAHKSLLVINTNGDGASSRSVEEDIRLNALSQQLAQSASCRELRLRSLLLDTLALAVTNK